MDLKKISKFPDKFSTGKQEKEWLKILSQRSEMIFEIWMERKKFLTLFVFSAILNILQSGGIIYLGTRASENIKILWTRVEKDTGVPVGTSVITKSNMTAEENEVKHFVAEFVLNVRTVPIDKNYYNNKLKEQSFFLTNQSQEKLNNMVRNDILILLNENRTTTTKIISVNKITNTKDTYQIRWSEEIFGINGAVEETRNYTGVFTVDHAILKTEEQILKNPLGIVIKDFSISRENGQ